MTLKTSKRKLSLWSLVLGTLITTSLSAQEGETEPPKPKSRFASARDFVKQKAIDAKQKVTEKALDVGCAVCTSPKVFLAKNDTVLSKALEQCVRKCPEGMNAFLDDLKKKQTDKEGNQRKAQEALGIAFSKHLKIYDESVDNKRYKEKKKNVKLSNSRQKELKQEIETLDKEISALGGQITKIEDAKDKVVKDIVVELDVKGKPLEGKEGESLKPEIKSEIERLAQLVSRINGTPFSFEEESEPTGQGEAAGDGKEKTEEGRS
jgi:hypothetical protein